MIAVCKRMDGWMDGWVQKMKQVNINNIIEYDQI